MKHTFTVALFSVFLLFLWGCQDSDIILPEPVALTDEAVGVYCGMILTEHEGPKAQVFEKFRKDPLWFTTVRDAINYLTLPGEAQDAIVVYVHDMGRASSWEKPQKDGIWIAVSQAYFVAGSRKLGGMGMPELIPFSEKERAEAFAKEHGGRVLQIADVTTEDLIAEAPDPLETVKITKEP